MVFSPGRISKRPRLPVNYSIMSGTRRRRERGWRRRKTPSGSNRRRRPEEERHHVALRSTHRFAPNQRLLLREIGGRFPEGYTFRVDLPPAGAVADPNDSVPSAFEPGGIDLDVVAMVVELDEHPS